MTEERGAASSSRRLIEVQGVFAAIVRFSLRFRGVLIALAVLFTAYAISVLTQAKYGVFPEFAPPQAVIQTESPGLSPEQVEVLVTQPIENALNGMEGIEALRSQSIQGLSVLTVTFKSSTDVYRDRQLVAERLFGLTGRLPQGVRPPAMTPLVPSTGLVLVLGLTSATRSPMDMRTIADWTIKQQLLAVPGVANVVVFGGEVRQIQIQVHPDRLVQFGIGMNDVHAAAQSSTAVEGAGFIDTKNQRIVLQTEGQSLKASEIGRTVVRYDAGKIVDLDDIATVKDAPEPPMGAATIAGKAGVMLMVYAQYGANILEVTKNVEASVKDLRQTMHAEGVAIHPAIFRPATFIERALSNIRSSLLIGAFLVIVVLVLFLFNLRTAAISCTAIPLSLLAAVVLLDLFGLSLNTMTLGGLAIAVGEVVDDAVIDVENILRRLRENRQKGMPKTPFRVVLDASLEVRTAVVFATFTVILVFIPILTISGLAGKLFSPLGIAYIFAILSSLLFALTLTPALCLTLLGSQHFETKESSVARWLKEKYVKFLQSVEDHRAAVITAVVLFVVAGAGLAQLLGGEFLPELREGHFILHVQMVPGTSLEESTNLGTRISAELLKLPYVQTVAQRVGRSEKADDTWGTHYSEFEIDLKQLNSDEMDAAQDTIRKVLTSFVGVSYSMESFLTERVQETLSGYTAPVVIHLFGNNLDTLDAKAQEAATVLSGIKGATAVQVQSPPGTPLLSIRLRRDALFKWGLNPKEVLDAIQTAYEGTEATQIYDGSRVFSVVVILDSVNRHSIDIVGNLLLRTSDSTFIHLRQVADVFETSGRYVVLHEGARRVQTITSNVTGRDVPSFVSEAEQRLTAGVPLPAGSYFTFGGTAQAQSQSQRDLLFHSALAAIGIILLLFIVLKRYQNVLLILANLPFAFVGGILSVLIFGNAALSLGALVGFVTLFGITMRNSIMMISHYEHLVTVEEMAWGSDAAVRGASERLVPILMTALVTGLGLLPLALGSGAAGREVEGPMAIVILGGLVTSTALNLLVLPTLALRYGKFQKLPADTSSE